MRLIDGDELLGFLTDRMVELQGEGAHGKAHEYSKVIEYIQGANSYEQKEQEVV